MIITFFTIVIVVVICVNVWVIYYVYCQKLNGCIVIYSELIVSDIWAWFLCYHVT